MASLVKIGGRLRSAERSTRFEIGCKLVLITNRKYAEFGTFTGRLRQSGRDRPIQSAMEM